MSQSEPSTASRRLDMREDDADSTFESSRSGTGEAVNRALVRRHVEMSPWSQEIQATSSVHPSFHSSDSKDTGPLVSFPPPTPHTPRSSTLHALQEWEGHVVEIGDDEFVSKLVDLTSNRAHETEEAVIPMVEISEYDASRMVVGSIFRWVIGYERSPEGTRTRVSRIVFRDLPRVTETDVQHGEEWARKISPVLNP